VAPAAALRRALLVGRAYARHMTAAPSSLDPDAAAFLEQVNAAGAPAVQDGTPEQARAAHLGSAARVAGPGERVEQVSDGMADGVPVRIFVPAGARGVTVYLHGGGWVVGTLESYDTLCRAVANSSQTTVVAVGYDLAPEAQHPVQLQQVATVLRWIRREITADEPLLLAGDSAGGYLAVLAADEAVGAGLPVAGMALVYPVVAPPGEGTVAEGTGAEGTGAEGSAAEGSAAEGSAAAGSMQLFASGHYLDAEAMRWYWRAYAPDGAPAAYDLKLSTLPPTLVITAGHDVLRDEGVELAERLAAAGVAVEHHPFPGQIHGFMRLTALVGQSRDALDLVGAFLAQRVANGG